MGVWLSGGGIVLVLIGAWFVAYEVVAKFRGDTHGAITPLGGIGKVSKLAAFVKWEHKRNRAMWVGLACITIGSFLQLAGLIISNCQ